MHDANPKPGDVAVYDGVEFFAIVDDGPPGCRSKRYQCEFNKTTNDYRCAETSCEDVIWLTKLDYTTHRLTS